MFTVAVTAFWLAGRLTMMMKRTTTAITMNTQSSKQIVEPFFMQTGTATILSWLAGRQTMLTKRMTMATMVNTQLTYGGAEPFFIIIVTATAFLACREADYDDEEDDYGHYGEEEDVGQQGLQPTKEDPGLFIVTCRCVVL
jgi:hypothetical protein